VTSQHYHVCCVNECEALLGEVEQVVKGPVARPEEVFKAILNMTGEEDDRQRFFGHLQKQLDHIADAHKGKVPLHGRLFGQWMHRAFPRECPFPHRAGSVQSRAPMEFGEKYLVTPKEIKKHTNAAKDASPDASLDGLWASELDVEDEELLIEYEEFGGSGLWGKVVSAISGGPAPILAGGMVLFLVSIALQDQLNGGKDGATLLPRQKLFV